jgi:ubiquinone/menaquinone biosynthesis C-methylase UbiE
MDMQEFYQRYYTAAGCSRAYAKFCRRVFGRDFSQHGFSDMAQLDFLIEVTRPGPTSRVLDLGCGSGGMAEYISDTTGARVTGVDFSSEAIRQAQARARGKEGRLAFEVADIAQLPFLPGSFEAVVSIDTLYFTELDATIAELIPLVTPEGLLAAFYTHGANPETPLPVFDRETLPPDKTPLGQALTRRGLAFRTWDFTEANYQHAQLKKRVLEELEPEFELEGIQFLFENRMGEALGEVAAFEAGANARYLYLARLRAA